ncbi:MAG: putative DNA binding domain-containing protein [Bdellovibrionales bacterium]|nr:putative DNA binding domain-containing protein [Bdellovibrionales bacterium]
MKRYTYQQLIELFESIRSAPSEEFESESIEFKEFASENALHNSKELAEEISAIANKNGGIIIIGVRDSSNVQNNDWNSQLVGFDIIDLIKTKERINGKLDPSLDLYLENIDFDSKNFLIIHVPYRRDFLVATKSGKVCIREGRSSRPMSTIEITEAVKKLQNYDWSAESLFELDVTGSLDSNSLNNAYNDYIKRKGIKEEISKNNFLEAIGVTRNGVLTCGGLLFLGKEKLIQEKLGNYEYRFSWKTKGGKLIKNEVWISNIWEAVSKTLEFFEDCNRNIEIELNNNKYQIPLLDKIAFHEAFLNAIVHRDYSGDGMIAINFTGNKIKISSPGTFYGGVTAENIAIHEPRHRNKLLARILMLFQLVDRAGMGVQRMGLRSLIYGRKFPVFKEIEDSVEVTMDAEFLIPEIFVVTEPNIDEFGLTELLILNSVFETGYIDVQELQKILKKVVHDPWESIQEALRNDVLNDKVELVGNRNGVYVKVVNRWQSFFKASRMLRITSASDKYVALYSHLKKYATDSNSNISNLLGHNHASQTSAFLREAKFVKREGKGVKAKWFIHED